MSLANRDLFLLASAIGSPDSLKMAALVYDALVERLGTIAEAGGVTSALGGGSPA